MNASAYLTTLVQVLTIDKMKRYLRFFKKTEKLLTDSFLRYLHEEKVFILEHINIGWYILEVGAGFGRMLKELSIQVGKNGWVLGIEINNLALKGSKEIKNVMRNVGLLRMNGLHLGFKDNVFDCVVFSWNILGNVDGNQRKELIRESIRVLKSGGLVVGSVYSEYSVTAQME